MKILVDLASDTRPLRHKIPTVGWVGRYRLEQYTHLIRVHLTDLTFLVKKNLQTYSKVISLHQVTRAASVSIRQNKQK